jgi:hypothetical protein
MEENTMTDFSRIKNLLGLNSPNGFPESEIIEILNTVGKLPKILLDYYKELGNNDFNDGDKYGGDSLINPKWKKYFLNEKYIVICSENQSVCWAGIKKTDLSHENPPVYFTCDEKISSDEKNWTLGCNNLYDYIHGFAYGNAVCYLDFKGYLEITDCGKEFIRNNFKNKNIKLNRWLSDGVDEFYGDYDDTIIMLSLTMGGDHLLYASNNEKHFKEIENKWKGIEMEYK